MSFGGWAPPRPTGKVKCSPITYSHNKGGLLLRERKGREGRVASGGRGEEGKRRGNFASQPRNRFCAHLYKPC